MNEYELDINNYRVYEDDTIFYPQIKGRFWGWNNLKYQGRLGGYFPVRCHSLQEARLYIQKYVNNVVSKYEYNNRKKVKKIHKVS